MEELRQAAQVLLDGGRRPGVGPDVGRHVQRRDRLEHKAPRAYVPDPDRLRCDGGFKTRSAAGA